jgi:S-DNA-T family DNA segregation ATPase FtsK/SpoIIIE
MSMPAIERVIPLVGQLPASIRDALARRLRELAGLALIALSGVAAAALMTWSVQDPSLSHATSRAIRNIVGYPGAIGADLLMQILGLGAIMLILPVAVWGWRMLTHRTFDREALRIACWILCTVISAGFASCWPHGRCRPGLAAWSATRWCAPPPWCSARPGCSIASCSGSSCSPLLS